MRVSAQEQARIRDFPSRTLALVVFCLGFLFSLTVGLSGPVGDPVWLQLHQLACALLLTGLTLWTLTLWGFVARLCQALQPHVVRGGAFPALLATARQLRRELVGYMLTLLLAVGVLLVLWWLPGPLTRVATALLLWGSAALLPPLLRYHWGLRLVRQRVSPT